MRLDRKIQLLAALPVFQQFEPNALHVLAFNAEERWLRAGELLFEREAVSDGGFLLLEGRIALNAHDTDVSDATILEPGALLGEAAMLAATRRPGTAVAAEPSLVLALPRSLLHRVLEAHPVSAAALRRQAASTIAATEFELKTLLE